MDDTIMNDILKTDLTLGKLMEAMNKKKRADSINLTIGAMLTILDDLHDGDMIKLSNNMKLFNNFESYRGYYEDLMLDVEADGSFGEVCTVGDLRRLLNRALREGIMEGYKGGEFVINKETLVWVDSYGKCNSLAVTNILSDNGLVTLVINKGDENIE